MALKDFLAKLKKRDEKFKEMKRNLALQKKLEERQKSSNERELERYMEEKRQERIKSQLAQIRKERQKELWNGPTILDAPNIFKGHKNILHQDEFTKGLKMQRHPSNMFFK